MILSIMVGTLEISFGMLATFPLDGPFLDGAQVVPGSTLLESVLPQGKLKLLAYFLVGLH